MTASVPPPSRRALFLDRDGTLIIDKVYLADPAGVELIAGTADALRRARELGYLLFLFTNQSGIGRGLHTLEHTLRVNARLEELLGLPPPLFTDICIAPEAPGQPVVYRKPSPRFILESLAKHALDPQQCWMIGDSAADLGAGLAAGINVAAVQTGKVDPRTLPLVAERALPVFPTFAHFAATLR
ncbi:HAD-IIIA family hydrolase [Horticoccus luteus]|uniref:D,D-heptose 1,7-bisphosphate phosphatase n=1 Tax=Horticoccus luteus TaxID=2862869 RepID=A0A8F9XKU4_9BACT|nr:HAD-IIIA family hydrolase [Horticoccus luteus]QYM78399.1 HAD-IIIA family hydrolase [Horticoccus luteus]